MTALEALGYDDIREMTSPGDALRERAYDEKQFGALKKKLDEVAKTREVPRAILLSGSGNDFAGKEKGYKLERLPNDKTPVPPL